MSSEDPAAESPDTEPHPPRRDPRAYPEELWRAESELLAERRAALEPAEGGGAAPRTVGFALSGGGVRSATFGLGIFQALARRRLLHRIDYLSSVSGGGYFASFLGSLYARDEILHGAPPRADGRERPRFEQVEHLLNSENRSTIVDNLRETGRYLAPVGSGDFLLAGAILLRNWLAVQVVIATMLLTALLGAQAVLALAQRLPRDFGGIAYKVAAALPWGNELVWWSPWVLLPLSLILLLVVPLGWAYWLMDRRWWPHPALGPVVILGLGGWLAWGGDLGLDTAGDLHRWIGGGLALESLLTLIVWLVMLWRGRKIQGALTRDVVARNRLSRYLATAIALTAVAAALALVDTLGQTLYLGVYRAEILEAWKLWAAGALGALTAAATLARWAVTSFGFKQVGVRPRLPVTLTANLAAALLVAALLIGVSVLAHAIVWGFDKPAAPAPAAIAPAATKRVLLEKAEGEVEMAIEIVRKHKAAAPAPREPGRRDWRRPVYGFAAGLALCLLIGRNWTFLNRSSHHPFYAGRLTRAYLGSTASDRSAELFKAHRGDDLELERYWQRGDNSAVGRGAPLHLINVTLNQTVGGRTKVYQPDRKGMGLAVGPCGLSAGVRHHLVLDRGGAPAPTAGRLERMGSALKQAAMGIATGQKEDRRTGIHTMKELLLKRDGETRVLAVYPEAQAGCKQPYRVFQTTVGPFAGERLSLGQWTAISGAAFSTGLGARTVLGLSLLLGLLNVRLGYWWAPGIGRRPRKIRVPDQLENLIFKLFPLHSYLFSELVARFPGSARDRWYLSDGGHFENLGVYELIRRKLLCIVVIDAEADPDYTFTGLANLVRKARVDFGAEIEFLEDEELDAELHPDLRHHFGSLDQLRRGRWVERQRRRRRARKTRRTVEGAAREELSLAHAALARVVYGQGAAEGRLLYIKPSLCGNEPADLTQYHAEHPDFPHESTADQLFDEAQWESYRKLGEHIGNLLFTTPGAPQKGGGSWTPTSLFG